MRELVVISGKGGTGKTSLVACFATLADNKVLADCDVDAPDLHLVLAPKVERCEPFSGGHRARMTGDICDACGRCADLCRFGAVRVSTSGNNNDPATYQIDPIACEGCGVCVQFCPKGCIELVPALNGEWFVSRTRHGPMVHARLGVAQDNSGKLVTLVRQEARALAENNGLDLIVTDGPPGIGCPVIASLGGADLALVVTEPTVTGHHDFERVVGVANHFGVPVMVCVNKWDLDPGFAERIERRGRELGATVAGRIPYDEVAVDSQMHQLSIVEHSTGSASVAIRNVWTQVKARLARDADGPQATEEPVTAD